MNRERFGEIIFKLNTASYDTLLAKNAKYSSDDDPLHNFNKGADIMGGTPAQACWGYLTKHLVALRDMVERNDFRDKDDLLEKCQDSINYIIFLYCLGMEENEKLEASKITTGTLDATKINSINLKDEKENN